MLHNFLHSNVPRSATTSLCGMFKCIKCIKCIKWRVIVEKQGFDSHFPRDLGTRDKAKQAKQAKGESSEEKNTLPIMSGKSRF
jgi:hypothetical protein